MTQVLNPRPRVALIRAGGTIDSVGADRLDLLSYRDTGNRVPDGGLIAQLPEIASIADVREVPFRRLTSFAIVEADWLDLLRLVTTTFDDDQADGVVISHGTNTLEETAYFLNLTVRTDRPVVLVGAMRPASGLSPDGPMTLLNAIRVATDDRAVGAGVLVVMNDAIWAARDVTKTATMRVDAFDGRDLGPLGYADPDRVTFYHQSLTRHGSASEFDISSLESLPRVDVVVSHVGADGALIHAGVAAGAIGLVSAGTGAGRPTPLETAALDAAVARGVVICQASRVGSGRTSGSPTNHDVVLAGNLTPWKARILLALALTKTRDVSEIQRMFETY
jgi:L-asparaginase